MPAAGPRRPVPSARTAADGLGYRIAAFALSWVVLGGGHVLRGRLVRGLVWFALLAALFVALPWLGFAGLAAALAIRLLLVPLDAAVIAAGPPHRSATIVLVVIGLFVAMVPAAVLVRIHVIEAFKMPAAGMAPTLAIDDYFMIDKRATAPGPGDVIVFRHPDRPQSEFAQRVVGVAGDRIAVRAGALYRNGEAVPAVPRAEPCQVDNRDDSTGVWTDEQGPCAVQTLGDHRFTIMVSAEPRAMEDFPQPDGAGGQTFPGSEGEGGEYTVPPGHVFTLGDNRGNSHDSRYWGPVPLANVRGTALYLWMSLGPRGVRWDRIGDRVP